MKLNNLIIVDGKFYRNGEEEKPIFGDLEQINILKKYNKAKEDGIFVRVDYEEGVISAYFKCLCGNIVSSDIEITDEIDERNGYIYLSEFDGDILRCPRCRQKYEVDYISNDDSDYLIANLK